MTSGCPAGRLCLGRDGYRDLAVTIDPDEAEQTFPASDPVGHWAGENPEDVRVWTSSMTTDQLKIGLQGRRFGSAAARNPEREDWLEEARVDETSTPDEPASRLRAGGNAHPAEQE